MRTIVECYLLLFGCVLAYAAVDEVCAWIVTWMDSRGDD